MDIEKLEVDIRRLLDVQRNRASSSQNDRSPIYFHSMGVVAALEHILLQIQTDSARSEADRGSWDFSQAGAR
jgi:hypothetical protein